MGSSSSKFRKHLQNGDEYAALSLFNNSSDLRKALDPNSSYGDTYNHDTPMHYAARHAMKSLLRIFLYELGGNPNKKNGRNETSLHCVCMSSPATCRTYALQQRRLECLTLILQWRGATLADGEIERADLSAQDTKQSTALHYAAASGLRRCVEVLVSQNSPLFIENALKQTPCDCAEQSGHSNIALYLESKMVFSNEDENEAETDLMLDQIEADEAYSGLRAQDLQEAKDQLLVETSDMLRVPLFTAEALLRNHEWSREMLLESWMADAFACCEKCGVVPPATLFEDASSAAAPPHETPPQLLPQQPLLQLLTPDDSASETICDICACLIPCTEEPVPTACDHQFCRSCWERYLTGKIQEGDAHNITCPAYQCTILISVDIIETLVSREMARRYLQFDIKAFVESNPNIKWCPYPGCLRAVKLPDSDNPLSPTFRDPASLNVNRDFSHAVDCGNGHMFCWECLGEAHEPASCDHWTQWHQKVAEVKPEELSGTDEETELAANCLWLVTNSKPCPNCKSPIQKNEGCNHMKCSKCKHDFCWVCLEAWKKHSSATGGYFRCNRYEVVRRVEQSVDGVKTDAEVRNKKMQELNKFLHYYTRFKNHENSYKLEEPLLSTAKEKMMILARSVTSDIESNSAETKFVEDAVQQLLKARRILKCSYVYGYYLEQTGYKKPIFEFMQTELEECTEALSEMVARPYLRTPRHKIIATAHLVQRKRHELVTAISKGLVPADNSPNLKKKRKKFSVELEEDVKKALLASIQDLNPATAWVKDPSGRHTNLSAVLDWPEESDDSDAEYSPANDSNRGLAKCVRKDCNRPRAQNPRTGEYHDHCSLKCMRLDQSTSAADDGDSPTGFVNDYELELLRALEMSRLQFLREMGQLRPGTGDSSRSPRTPGRSPGGMMESTSAGDVGEDMSTPIILQDPPKGRSPRLPLRSSSVTPTSTQEPEDDRDLRLAIELSLRDSVSPEPLRHHRLSPAPLSATLPLSDNHNPFSDEYSTIVTRVPNKSVEDLALEVPAERGHTHDTLGACGGLLDKKIKSHDPHSSSNQNQAKEDGSNGLEQMHVANTFGLIKDISVTNILSSDRDKTKDFEKKDFSQFYAKSQVMGESGEIENVFEPRPHVADNQSLARKLHLTPNNITVCSSNGRRQDVWLEQNPASPATTSRAMSSSPISRSTRDVSLAQPYCLLGAPTRSTREQQPYCPLSSVPRSPKDTCPLVTSPFSRSPRETCPLVSVSRSPRDRRSFSGYECQHSSGRNTPDSLRVATVPRRCTSWGDNSFPVPSPPSHPAEHHSSHSASHSAFDTSPFDDENDPGPHLDAVLRSLSKLTARLGDDDQDLFPNYEDTHSARSTPTPTTSRLTSPSVVTSFISSSSHNTSTYSSPGGSQMNYVSSAYITQPSDHCHYYTNNVYSGTPGHHSNNQQAGSHGNQHDGSHMNQQNNYRNISNSAVHTPEPENNGSGTYNTRDDDDEDAVFV